MRVIAVLDETSRMSGSQLDALDLPGPDQAGFVPAFLRRPHDGLETGIFPQLKLALFHRCFLHFYGFLKNNESY